MKCKPLCFITSLLLFIGGLNWGLVGLGGFLNKNLNVLNLLLGTWAWLENVIYLLVGVAALVYGYFLVTHCKSCKEDECKCGGESQGTCA